MHERITPTGMRADRYVRHPGYLGWYLWCVGGQLLLVNPLCTAGFACVVSTWAGMANSIWSAAESTEYRHAVYSVPSTQSLSSAIAMVDANGTMCIPGAPKHDSMTTAWK